MANGDEFIPQLADPNALAKRARAAAEKVGPQRKVQAGASAQAKIGPYAAVYELLQGIEDPLEKDIVRLSYQDLFRDLTGDATLKIPTEEEYLIQTQERANQLHRLRIEGAKLRVQGADAVLEGASPEVQSRWGFRPGLLAENPKAWLMAVGQAGGDITMEDLMLAAEPKEVTLDEAALAEGAAGKQRKALSEQAGAIRDVEFIGKSIGETLAGKTTMAADVGEITKGVEALFGELTPSNLDEAGGSKGLVALRARLNQALEPTLKRRGVAALVSQKYGKAAADQLEEAAITKDGKLDPSVGTTWISKDAAYYLSAFALGVADDTNTSFGQVLQQWGVEGVSDLDSDAFLVETQRRADADPAAKGDSRKLFADMGLSGLLRREYARDDQGRILTWGDALASLSGKR